MSTQISSVESSSSLLTIVDGTPKADSRMVAEVFKKKHFSVLRDIQNLEIPEEFRESNFGFSKYRPENSRRSYPYCLMTRDGFTLLAMGFTGKEAVEWKLKYINAFNSMERQLVAGQGVIDIDKLAAALAPKLKQEVSLVDHRLGDESISRAETVIDACGVNLLPQPDCVHLMQAIRSKTGNRRSGRCNSEYFTLRRLLFLRFGVRSFASLRKVDFKPALRYVEAHNPQQTQLELLGKP